MVVVAFMGCVVIVASVFVAVWHKALPADGPSLDMPAAGVIRLDGGSVEKYPTGLFQDMQGLSGSPTNSQGKAVRQ